MKSWSMKETEDGVSFKVKVQPRSGKNEVCGLMGDALKIKLTAPPVDGEANEACLRFLAQWLAVPRSRFSLVSGQTSTQKIIRVTGVKTKDLLDRLAQS